MKKQIYKLGKIHIFQNQSPQSSKKGHYVYHIV